MFDGGGGTEATVLLLVLALALLALAALLGDEVFPRLLLLLQTPTIEAALVFLSLSLFRLRSPSLFL